MPAPAQMPPEADANRARLAELMDERRRELRLEWGDVARAGGIGLRTLGSVRTGRHSITDPTKDGIEAGLRWQRGSVDAILAGGDPVPLPPAPPAPAAAPAAGWSPALQADPDEIAPFEGAVALAALKAGPAADGAELVTVLRAVLAGRRMDAAIVGDGSRLAAAWDLFSGPEAPPEDRVRAVALLLMYAARHGQRQQRRASGLARLTRSA